MACFRSRELLQLFEDNIKMVDHHIQYWMASHNKTVVRTIRNQLVHSMWSVYAETNGAHKEYLELKAEKKMALKLWRRHCNATDANFSVVF